MWHVFGETEVLLTTYEVGITIDMKDYLSFQNNQLCICRGSMFRKNGILFQANIQNLQGIGFYQFIYLKFIVFLIFYLIANGVHSYCFFWLSNSNQQGMEEVNFSAVLIYLPWESHGLHFECL
tara:strand:- start:10693 stop:11061 length:369 start_codon:yes stop_codon:yes gene_type:complete